MERLKRPWLIAVTVVMSVMFAVFSWFQINDLDPTIYHKPSAWDAWSWVVFYGLLAVLCLVSVFRSVPRAILILAAVFCAFEMARTAPGVFENLFQSEKFTMTGASMAPERSEVELSREFFGALIGLVSVAFLWWQSLMAKRLSNDS